MIPDFANFTWDSWANSQAVRVFLAGFIVGAFVRITRAGLKWFRRAGTDTNV